MEGLRQYVISLVAAALLCGILTSLLPNGRKKDLVNLLCGVFLALIFIKPVSHVDFDTILNQNFYDTQQAERIVSAGQKMVQESMADIIKAESEAYILDKAALLNASLEIDITIGAGNLPVSAVMSGNISTYARNQLEDILETDLGITKENQKWSG